MSAAQVRSNLEERPSPNPEERPTPEGGHSHATRPDRTISGPRTVFAHRSRTHVMHIYIYSLSTLNETGKKCTMFTCLGYFLDSQPGETLSLDDVLLL